MPVMEPAGLWKTTREVSGGQKYGQKKRSCFKKKNPGRLIPKRPGRVLLLRDIEKLTQGWSVAVWQPPDPDPHPGEVSPPPRPPREWLLVATQAATSLSISWRVSPLGHLAPLLEGQAAGMV